MRLRFPRSNFSVWCITFSGVVLTARIRDITSLRFLLVKMSTRDYRICSIIGPKEPLAIEVKHMIGILRYPHIGLPCDLV